jgi:hypothetical protein
VLLIYCCHSVANYVFFFSFVTIPLEKWLQAKQPCTCVHATAIFLCSELCKSVLQTTAMSILFPMKDALYVCFKNKKKNPPLCTCFL